MCEAKRGEGVGCGRRRMVLVRMALGAVCDARRRARWAIARGSMITIVVGVFSFLMRGNALQVNLEIGGIVNDRRLLLESLDLEA